MLATLGALVYGIIATGSWISADNQEKESRNNSIKKKCDFYFDKNGHMRHTNNGKRYTPEEVDREFNPVSLQERKAQIDKRIHDNYNYIYYTVKNVNDIFIKEVFLTKEEAELYVINNYSDDDSEWHKRIGKTCKHIFTMKSCKDLYHVNFQIEEDK